MRVTKYHHHHHHHLLCAITGLALLPAFRVPRRGFKALEQANLVELAIAVA